MKTIAITGTSRGIGLELVRQLVARGDQVIALCRTSSPELQELNIEIHDGIDVADDACMSILQNKLGGKKIDYIVNNAGLLTRETLEDLDFERIRKQFEVNTLGPLRVSKALLPNLSDGSKIFIVSSRVGSLADNSSGGNYGYRMSKTAVNMGGLNLAHDLKAKGIGVFLLHPGYVRTEMTGNHGNIEPSEAASGLIARIDELTLEKTGTFWHAEGYELPW